MANTWEKTSCERRPQSMMRTLLSIVTLGIATDPEPWTVEYTDRQTGSKVTAAGSTPEEAEARARARCAA